MSIPQYHKALPFIQEVHQKIQDSPEVLYELGLCHLKKSRKREKLIMNALDENPSVKYGEPYLKLGEVFSKIHS